MSDQSPYPNSTRPVAMGVNGMTTTAHPLASLAGIRILADGGNAFDAAVTIAATLNVVEPYMSGVGGIGVALVYVSRENRVRALDFSGRAPQAADPSRFTAETKETGILSSLVPGNVAGWAALHETYGTMEWDRLFQPAIKYAENGFPITLFNSQMMTRAAPKLRKLPSATIVLDNAGEAPRPGAHFKMPELGESLRKIAREGKGTMYTGELAEQIVKTNHEMGGILTLTDLTDYKPRWQDPISIIYRGHKIYTTPPNSSGFQILQTLKLMEGFKASKLSYQHPDTLHLLMEATKICVTDRIKYGGDPDYVDIPVNGLLSDTYADQQRLRIESKNAAVVSGEHHARHMPPGSLVPGNPTELLQGGMTTHFAVTDNEGNVVSVTQTLGAPFGSAVVVPNTGVFLNNMCYWFDLEDDSPNQIGPGKRVDFVVAPTQTFKDGNFILSMGTPGSWGILQTTPQFLMNVLDYGMTVQQAIEAPRFRYYTGKHVEMEERFPDSVRRALQARGHEVTTIEPWSMTVGGAQGIKVEPGSGVLQGGADPRRDGCAIGL